MVVRRIVASVLLGLMGGGISVMSASAQTPLSPGAALPSIETSLQRLDGSSVTPQDLLGENGTVFLFWSNQCPWIDRYERRVQSLIADMKGQGVQFVRVNANEADASSGETLEASRARAEEEGYAVPYVRDSTAAFARALGATRTPQAFVFNQDQTLVYVGAIDDTPSGAEQVDAPYLRRAVESMQATEDVPTEKTSAFGCALKHPE